MDLELKGKVVFITGGSRGIGKGIARTMAREGCNIAITATRADLLETTATEIKEEFGVEVAWFVGDLLRTDDAERVVNEAIARFSRIDILVNNAGAAAGGVLETLSDQAWETGLGLKFMGYVRITRAVIPHMRKEGVGRVINLIGNDGVKHSYWEIVPGAANAAGQNLTIALAGQYAKENITFCAVNPGPVRTERWVGLVEAMARDLDLTYEQADQLAPRSIPLGRIAEVDEVSDLVCYLASPKAHFVNGTMIEIDGGQMKPVMDSIRDQV
ncbi:MAG TPA: SDR family NAD(P)-dependent oxidoreductase [Gammaproteobacteria bacterium]|jgi:3-oxoacyl-[acyl-carrier protein] reductase|nr:short-chain dehydrogenase [Gammaproteobacteria bacterium]HIA87507.1 SDR family NAD(P)-dependent oxidoreductase [Gammaproteobacteria bacterium]HIM70156.1 SDR family NAD(P)-dependent oxidoreductase [Gammaproteobacteria bacterium]|tara:strand:+ start:144 stop:956 length:813 start_codon:yes stop_codon:yes gene_type:complete